MRVLDIYAGVGAATRGYQLAGHHVTGVDNAPQPDYCGDAFIEADARDVMADRAFLSGFDFAHTSPPCQSSCSLTKGTNRGREYPQLIPITRRLLVAAGLPFVIENVPGAPIRRDLMLCGEIFGLGVIRHRFFELHGITVEQPTHKPHRGRVAGMRHGQWFDGPYFAVYGEGGGKGTIDQWRDAMGIDWTRNRKSIAEAIPPAYTRLIGQEVR